MQTICQIDLHGRFLGASHDIEDDEGCPVGWVFASPPEGGGVVAWSGLAWFALPAGILLDDRKAALTAAANDRRDAVLAGGFTVPASASAALAGKVLQTRDADDKINWKLSRDAYKEAVEAGAGQAPQATFRTADNVSITVAIAEGLAVLTAMQAWGVAVLGRSWSLKDTIAAATELAALDAIDITAGWPA